MSWNVHITAANASDALAKLKEADIPAEYKGRGHPHEAEIQHQLDAAKKAAAALVQSGAVGKPDLPLTINLNGHANPGHEKVGGYAHDQIDVRVSQT